MVVWLSLLYFKILVNFTANEYGIDSCMYLYADVPENKVQEVQEAMPIKYKRLSRRSSTNNALCIGFNMTCDAGYVGYTHGHLHALVDGHKQKPSQPREPRRSPGRPTEALQRY